MAVMTPELPNKHCVVAVALIMSLKRTLRATGLVFGGKVKGVLPMELAYELVDSDA